MNLFVVALIVGGLGLVAMALLGMGSGSHAGGGHTATGHGGPVGHVAHAAHLIATKSIGKAAGRASANTAGFSFVPFLATLASPRVILSVLFGFGLSGLVARRFVSEGAALALATGGGILFEAAFVAPLWRFLFRFASKPAETLDHALFSAAQAVTNFDKDGNGVVKIEVDGQVLQLLATLRVEDRSMGARVHSGDELIVEEIDEVRQRCRVSTR